MTVPKIMLSIEVEGTPEIKIEAEGADLDRLLEWLRSPRVVERLDLLALLVTSRTRSGDS